MYRELGDRGFSVVAVDVRDDREGTRAFYEQGGFVLPNAFDTKNVAIGSYRVAGTPTTFLVDERGMIVWRRYGFLPGEEEKLRERVLEYLADIGAP